MIAATAVPFSAAAQNASDVAVLARASVSVSPPSIALAWPAVTATGYAVSRKGLDDVTWTLLDNTLPGTATGYTDTGVTVGSAYEYRIHKNGSPAGDGYVYAGIRAALTEARGTLILLVDTRFTASLASELARLERDLIGDGWRLLRHDVSSGATVASVKALIQADYNAAPAEVKALFLFGHIPQPYSGAIAPDGHSDHVGAWPADVSYGELNGTWTDSTVSSTSSSWPRQHNVPGDGKFDQSFLPSPADVQVGRVDLYDMPAFAFSEAELLRRYLDKDHKFRRKWFTAQARGLIDDNFGYFGGEAFAASGWRAGSAFFGASSVVAADFFSTLGTNPYLFSYGCGGGGFNSISGVGSTADFAANEVQSVFTLLFGSYFGDWDSQNNALRAPLASSPWALTCGWAGRPHWFMHHMALGLPIGHSARVTQNNNNAVYSSSSYGGYVHVGLMGDPTLRLHPVAPPSQLLTATNASGSVVLSWTASAEPVEGYHVYRSPVVGGPYTRLSASPETGTLFTDAAPLVATNHYMVRAVKLQESASGSYYNPSQGTFGAYPDRPLTLTVASPYGVTLPAAGVASYSSYDATVLCMLSNSVIEQSGTRLVATGWTGTGDVPASGTAFETPLLNLTRDSTLTWQWQTNYWLGVSAGPNGTVNLPSGWYAAGGSATLSATATAFRHAFSRWSGTGVPAGMEQANPLTVSLDSARELVAYFEPCPNPDNALLFTETFEAYPSDMPLPGTNGWHAAAFNEAAVTTDPAVIAGITAYGQSHPFPVKTTHTKAGIIDGNVSLRIVSAPQARVVSKLLMKLTPLPEDEVPVALSSTNQMGLALTVDGRLRLFHGTPVTGVKLWSIFTGATYDREAWHTVTLEVDYASTGQDRAFFRVSIDNGPWLTHADGLTANDGTGAPGGAWFATANPSARRMDGIAFEGVAQVDDIVVAEVWSGQGGPGDLDNDGMWDAWEMQHFGATNALFGGAADDWDGDGADNRSEWQADTQPDATNSVLALRDIALEPGGARIIWQGGVEARQYLERSDDLRAGVWQAIFTNLPPTEVLNERLDDGSAAPQRFYRIRALRD